MLHSAIARELFVRKMNEIADRFNAAFLSPSDPGLNGRDPGQIPR
jgi:hypothetical protein